ncbi:hypothetical protein M8818_001757 [Zalaria obscura]|uniref:Uncharacterized protein n=1 Tax=Zalaria obscura TaxID=2024903 RepID=A0ACC3SJY0_9PEZI
MPAITPKTLLSRSLSRTPASRSFTSASFRRADPKDTKITSNYEAPPAPRGRGNTGQLPVFPLVAIFFTGSFLFWRLLKEREGQGQSHYTLPPRDPRPYPPQQQSEH